MMTNRAKLIDDRGTLREAPCASHDDALPPFTAKIAPPPTLAADRLEGCRQRVAPEASRTVAASATFLSETSAQICETLEEA